MADSVSEAVGDKALAAVVALNLLPPASVVKRKQPTLPEGKTAPAIVVSVGAFGDVAKVDALTDLVSYPVAVTVVTGDGEVAADDPVPRKWLDQIRKKLQSRASWAGLTGFNTVKTTGKEPFDPTALNKNWNYGTQVFTVSVLESRT